MSWAPASRNPTERDVRIESHGESLRVELYRGGKLQAVRLLSKFSVTEALEIAERWLVLGPAIFALERARLDKVAA